MNDEVLVSINCITYNHENYIRDALDSMLNQKTNFKYEIIIHDDASTDNTAEIIKEYQKKYSEKIKAILQNENQFTLGIRTMNHKFNHSRSKGKYIALCEGDDYWIDENKLQKQFDYMELNPNCTFCFHNAIVMDQEKFKKEKKLIPWMPENRSFFNSQSRKYTAGELQLLGFIPTASFMYPKYVLDNPPQWFLNAVVGDNATKLLASHHGYAYYMNEVMSIYRFNTPNSATTKWSKDNTEMTIIRCEKFLEMLNDFNIYSDYKHNENIQLSKLTWEVQLLKLNNKYKDLRSKEYKRYLELIPPKNKMINYVYSFFPLGVNIIKKIRRNFKSYIWS